jgi:hypothetical protein
MEGAQTLAFPGSPVTPRPGAVQRAGVATDQSQVLGTGPPQGGRPLTGVPVIGGPNAGVVIGEETAAGGETSSAGSSASFLDCTDTCTCASCQSPRRHT